VKYIAAAFLTFVAFNGTASAVELHGKMIQGALMRGIVAPGSRVTVDGKELQLTPDGQFVFGIGRDAGTDIDLAITDPAGETEELHLPITQRKWEIARVDGLPEKTVNPDPATLEQIKKDSAAIHAARKQAGLETGFEEKFLAPVTALRVSEPFGSQRILNGETRAPHIGIDLAVPIGTAVLAPASGKVILVASDMVLTGGTVMIDHGYGVTSVYAHLSEISVKPGDALAQGQEFAKSGMTGRATGPHLHWGVFWFETALDPGLLAPVP
jgi:murein DD-endopeptidase MepM/ murein hydrolase activator NlpD